MLVVMQPGSDQAAVETVRRYASEAGLESTIFDDGKTAIVHLAGEVIPEIAGELGALPGVELIIRPQNQEPPVTSNVRISGLRPLVPPAILMEQFPLPAESAIMLQRTRHEINRIFSGNDDRLVVVVGPCSIHDADSAID